MSHLQRVLKILSVCESPTENQEIIHSLESCGFPIHHETVATQTEFSAKLDCDWTLILFMSSTPAFAAREALLETKKHATDLPFVLVSHGIGEEEVANLMKAGAEDVVLLSRSHRLIQVVRRILREREMREKEARASTIAHKAYAAREQMLAIVSHDIKNPLSAIQLEAQMLHKIAERHPKSLLAEEVKIQANRILKTTDRLKNLISDLLDKNKSEEGLSSISRSECHLARLIQEVLDSNRPLLKQKDILIQASCASELRISADKSKLQQVLNNLLSNSIKFTPHGGMISIQVEDAEDEMIFSICDNGPGLKQQDVHRVFEKYWTAGIPSSSGTGLGLFICKTIVEAHGGQIKVENLEGRGCRFSFNLPRPLEQKQRPLRIRDQRRKVLIIDDDHDLREVISWALGREGFSVHAYGDAREALIALERGQNSPQLIVVDYHMDGMDGSDFVRKLRGLDHPELKACPVMMISASPDEATADINCECYQEILSKPIDLEDLVSKVRQYAPQA